MPPRKKTTTKAPARKKPAPRRARKKTTIKRRSGPGELELAAEATIGDLEERGRLEPIDTVRVQALRGIARALDDDPHNAQLWRELREAFEALRYDDDDADSALEELVADLRSSVRDTEA